MVVGYFNSDDEDSSTYFTAANNRGQADAILTNAIQTDGYPSVNIHTYEFESGEHTLSLEKGRVLILGFIDGNQELSSRDVGFSGDGEKEAIDWLFY